MGIVEFFKALFGGPQAPVPGQPRPQIETQKHKAKGKLAASRKCVSLLTLGHELRVVLADRLKPVVEAEGYSYDDHPSIDGATGSQVIIVDGTPRSDARLHDKYDQVLRMKKSLGKVFDITCVVGRRADYKKYPRGTYPNVLYFCVTEGDLDRREPDLPTEGTTTIEGPTLYNFADLPQAVVAKIRELSKPTKIL